MQPLQPITTPPLSGYPPTTQPAPRPGYMPSPSSPPISTYPSRTQPIVTPPSVSGYPSAPEPGSIHMSQGSVNTLNTSMNTSMNNPPSVPSLSYSTPSSTSYPTPPPSGQIYTPSSTSTSTSQTLLPRMGYGLSILPPPPPSTSIPKPPPASIATPASSSLPTQQDKLKSASKPKKQVQPKQEFYDLVWENKCKFVLFCLTI